MSEATKIKFKATIRHDDDVILLPEQELEARLLKGKDRYAPNRERWVFDRLGEVPLIHYPNRIPEFIFFGDTNAHFSLKNWRDIYRVAPKIKTLNDLHEGNENQICDKTQLSSLESAVFDLSSRPHKQRQIRNWQKLRNLSGRSFQTEYFKHLKAGLELENAVKISEFPTSTLLRDKELVAFEDTEGVIRYGKKLEPIRRPGL